MTLRDWLKNGWLSEHVTSHEEIANLLGLCDRDLQDCRTVGLSSDWRFSIAYNAALQAATAALAASGYRAAREAHHYRVLQSLTFTINAQPALVRRLDAFRKKRNIGGYESAGAISDQEAEEMTGLAAKLRELVEREIRTTRPELLS
ncbi:MAG: hypothetical protein HY901_33600 [Deltaproteobacteria bacterium]|nr:hypothetical protein [Deltaproteobacteria bacterium]